MFLRIGFDYFVLNQAWFDAVTSCGGRKSCGGEIGLSGEDFFCFLDVHFLSIRLSLRFKQHNYFKQAPMRVSRGLKSFAFEYVVGYLPILQIKTRYTFL